jgi:hypothetical protein
MGKRGVAKQVPPSLVPKLSPKKVVPASPKVNKVPLSLLRSIEEEPEVDEVVGDQETKEVCAIEEKYGEDPAARTTQEKRQREEAAEDSSSDASDQQECKRHRGEDADPPPEYVSETQNGVQGEAQWQREMLDKEEAEEKEEEEQGTTPMQVAFDIHRESSADEVTAVKADTEEQKEATLETVAEKPSLVNVVTVGAQEETKNICVQAVIQIATPPKLAKREPSPKQGTQTEVCTYYPSLNDATSATILWPIAPRGISPLHQRLALQAASAAARAVVASIAAYALERELEHEYIG